ncbi:hypothetical protein FGO68_gene5501 [Halteria grandinella]|uniref:Uncharacterized protein n=1 Tax=Halteria grandinella TaxID=5974 RepID=A0A8J8T3F8_HALGN|nr:hypothetical protein FGO68_gene5501 [Halteria grandinella]
MWQIHHRNTLRIYSLIIDNNQYKTLSIQISTQWLVLIFQQIPTQTHFISRFLYSLIARILHKIVCIPIFSKLSRSYVSFVGHSKIDLIFHLMSQFLTGRNFQGQLLTKSQYLFLTILGQNSGSVTPIKFAVYLPLNQPNLGRSQCLSDEKRTYHGEMCRSHALLPMISLIFLP